MTIYRYFRSLADNDKDGRLTADEFVVAMHCCDIVRAGQTLPYCLPNEWSRSSTMQHERASSSTKSNMSQTFVNINSEIQDVFKSTNVTDNHSPETVENERKNSIITYEEKRQKNYEVHIHEQKALIIVFRF